MFLRLAKDLEFRQDRGMQQVEGAAAVRRTYYRWTICALLFLATTINYVDRQILGILAPDLQKEIGWSEAEYGYIVTSFQTAYAVGLLVVGRLMDWLGTRRGFTIAVAFWSVAAMAHAAARSAVGFGVARFALGLGESGNFPGSIKTVAEWFPKKERALATGIFNAGSNVGAVVAPLLVPWITLRYGWPEAFIFTGALGFVWLVLWLVFYYPPQRHVGVSRAELDYILSDPVEPAERISWERLFPQRQTLAFALGKFMTDPIWWFYLYWLPKFLNQKHGLTLDKMGLPLVAIYLLADVGSIGGGWLSSSLIQRGWSVNAGRKMAMLVCALCVVPIGFASLASHLWVAVGLIGLAAAAHQGWSANLFTMTSDMFPRRAIGSVVGIGGMAGAVGGMFVASGAGLLLELTGSYLPLFLVASTAYLGALGLIHWLVPGLEPAQID